MQIDLTALSVRVEALERTVLELKQQLKDYTPSSVSTLQIQGVKDTVDRIETDLSEAKKYLLDMNEKIVNQDANQKQLINNTQMKMLWAVLSGFGSIIIGITIAFLTHHIV